MAYLALALVLVAIGMIPLTDIEWMWSVDAFVSALVGSEAVRSKAWTVTFRLMGAVSILLGIVLMAECLWQL